MKIQKVGLLATAMLLAASLAWLTLPSQAAEGDVLSGVVQSKNGPEAGVWVIAETTDLPTKFRKIVVTTDGGRYLIPDLPAATYNVWVRGYGLVDSKPVTAKPGQTLDLAATVAATPREAAQVYPADYWYSLLEPPATSEFPGTGPSGNGIAAGLQVQAQWIDITKQACMLCHQLGNKVTREIASVERFDSTVAAWDHRVQVGQRGAQMNNPMGRFGRQRGLQMYADWTDRIASGEVPPAPPRPRGVERNLVISMWEWATEIDYAHDEVATDKRNPRVNANGPIYGSVISNDLLAVLDPRTHTAYNLKIPVRADPATIQPMIATSMPAPSPFYGEELLWNDPANPHNPMIDGQGRVWLTSAIREEQPAWCKQGSDHPSAKYFPLATGGGRQAAYYDPSSRKFVLIDTCFGTHHLQFAEDRDNTLFFSGGGQVTGWINTAMYDKTGDERISQGWCPTVVDTNGDGKITKPWNEPVGGGRSTEEGAGGGRLGQFDPKLDTRVNIGSYGIVPDPKVHTAVWLASTSFPGRVALLDLGSNPPETCITEMYEVPSVLDPKVPKEKTGFGSRGIDIDRNGVVWTALSGSSHFASFDRTKCRVKNGPSVVDGRHCVDGWELYPTPGPVMRNTDPPVRADHHYYNWVDQWNTLGLGENVPIADGSNSDSLLALLPATKEWVILRVPYPTGFFSRGLDGRIDDPNAGWKGRGVWATYGAAATWHIEGGKGVKPGLMKFQIRPDPLAR